MTCPSCKEEVMPIAPKTAWKIAVVLFWVGLLAISMLYGTLLGLNVVLVPVWCAMAGAVGVATDRATSWSCPACHAKLVPIFTTRDEAREHRAAAMHHPRHA
ncbi:MAG: hypothetical protein FWD69_02270 [Polyangiaceae bacterium]|nr:hypothetical protein [Polyangiaceae bacterium]